MRGRSAWIVVVEVAAPPPAVPDPGEGDRDEQPQPGGDDTEPEPEREPLAGGQSHVTGAVQAAFQVSGPTIPSTGVSAFSVWKAMQMPCDWGPYWPSTASSHPRAAIWACQV